MPEKGTIEYWDSIRQRWKETSLMKACDPEDDKQTIMHFHVSAAIPVPKEQWSQIQNTQPEWIDYTRGEYIGGHKMAPKCVPGRPRWLENLTET